MAGNGTYIIYLDTCTIISTEHDHNTLVGFFFKVLPRRWCKCHRSVLSTSKPHERLAMSWPCDPHLWRNWKGTSHTDMFKSLFWSWSLIFHSEVQKYTEGNNGSLQVRAFKKSPINVWTLKAFWLHCVKSWTRIKSETKSGVLPLHPVHR